MARIVSVESSASPYVIGINAEMRLKRQPRNKAEASAWAAWLVEQGYSIDMGVAQINSKNLARLGLDFTTVFEPCANLRAASQLLTENYQLAVKRYGEGQAALQAALSMYNSGRFQSAAGVRYVQKLSTVEVPKVLATR